MTSKAGKKPPPQWAEMLARVEQALATAIAVVDQREQALTAAPTPPPAAVDLSGSLTHFGERLRGLAECAARAEQTVTDLDRELTAGEETLRAWFHTAEAARRKLADWVGKA